MAKVFIRTSGTLREVTAEQLLKAVFGVQQTEDIDALYKNEKFAEIITLCAKNPNLIYTEDATKTTLFGMACRDGYVDLVRGFLKIPGIDVSKGRINLLKEEWNLSGFDLAVQNCQKDVIKLFLLHGHMIEYSSEGVINIRTGGLMDKWSTGPTSLENQIDAMLNSLLQAEKEVDTLCSKVEVKIKALDLDALFDLVKSEPDLFTWIIKEKPEHLSVKNYMGQNLLHYAARKGMTDLVDALVKTGLFDLDGKDTKGFTATDYAIHEGHQTLATTLLKSGATYSKLVELYNFYLNLGNPQKTIQFEERAKVFLDTQKTLAQDININPTEKHEEVDLSGNTNSHETA